VSSEEGGGAGVEEEGSTTDNGSSTGATSSSSSSSSSSGSIVPRAFQPPGAWHKVPLTYELLLSCSIHPTPEQLVAYEQSAAFLEDSFEVRLGGFDPGVSFEGVGWWGVC